MKTTALLALLAALASLSPLVSAQTAMPREVNEERIAAAFADARAALAEHLKVEVDAKFAPRLVSSKDVAARVAEENLPIFRLRQPDAELAKAEAEQAGAAFGQSALAKYTWTTRELLVSAKTWRRQAVQLGRPELTSDETLRAVLVHELVHALDDARHDIGKLLGGMTTVDACLGFTGVLEGHAQLVARRVCELRGWSKGFETLTANIGGLPAGAEAMDPSQLEVLRAQGAINAAPYVAGERFMAAVEARGAEFVARAFQSPPDNPDLLYHPDWYLDPKTRPQPKFALDAAIDVFAAPRSQDEWQVLRMTPPEAQLESSLLRLPPERAREALRGRVASRTIVLQPRADLNSKLLSAVVHEFADEAALGRFVAAGTELSALRDDDMRKAERVVRLKELTTRSIDAAAHKGRIDRRSLANGTFEFVATLALLARGPVYIELVFSNEAIEDDALLALADRMFDAAKPAITTR
ncbi:MAG: hypothetical protein IPJ77_06945 [Planctomycetes bacterium]|nr:hypothetical protein [Planctomycetota bacterium]